MVIMDPISLALSTYLNHVQVNIHQQMTDIMGTEVQAVSIKYEGFNIPYQYQIWKIKDKSVCNTYRNQLAHYSTCTIKAKKLFNTLCSKLDKKKSTHWKHKKIKNMYCNAAISYKPMIASITPATNESPLQLARKECNQAIVAAMGTGDKSLELKQKEICERYNNLDK